MPDDQFGNLSREAFGVRELAPAFGTAHPPGTFVHSSEPVIHIGSWILEFLWILVLVSLDLPRRQAQVLAKRLECGSLLPLSKPSTHPARSSICPNLSFILDFGFGISLDLGPCELGASVPKGAGARAEAPRPPINPFAWEFRVKLPRHPGRSETTLKDFEAFRRALKLLERSCKAVLSVPFVPSLSSPLRERLD